MASEVTDIDITEDDIIADLLAEFPANEKPDSSWVDEARAAEIWKVGTRVAKARLEKLVNAGTWEINRDYIGLNGRPKSYYRRRKSC